MSPAVSASLVQLRLEVCLCRGKGLGKARKGLVASRSSLGSSSSSSKTSREQPLAT